MKVTDIQKRLPYLVEAMKKDGDIYFGIIGLDSKGKCSVMLEEYLTAFLAEAQGVCEWEADSYRERLKGLVTAVNVFMESCEEHKVKIPFLPCEALMWQVKTEIEKSEQLIKGKHNDDE